MWNFILYLKDFPANEAELIRWVLDGITPHYGKGVAPHAGAWIETMIARNSSPCSLVAPHAGAWIETANVLACHADGRVAPHAGAWIETRITPGR